MAITFEWKTNTLSKNFAQFQTKLAAVVLMYMATKATKVEADMKMNRPWTDRTGMAKATLNARVSQPSNTVIRMTLAHGVDYGIWLELAHNKNYAIVGPTITKEGPRITDELNDIFSQLK